MHPKRVLASVAAVLGVVLVACGSTPTNRSDATAARAAVAAFTCPQQQPSTVVMSGSVSSDDHRLQIVTTVAPITSIVANIAGDRADVHGVIPEGEDSHTFEPKPSVAKLMSTADLVFVNGLKLEDPTKEIADANLPEDGRIVELGTLTLSPDQYIYDFSFPADGGKPNPHLWTDPPMAACYATIAAEAMAGADPTNASYYGRNLARFTAKLDELDRAMVAATASLEVRDRALLTYHDAYAYFAAHYGWTVIGAVQVSSFEDPTPKEVGALIDQIKAQRVPAIFGSEVFPSPVLEQIAAETGTTYVDELRDDDLPGSPGDTDHSYLGLMKFDFVTMITALGGEPGALAHFDASDVVVDSADYPQ